MKLLMAEIMSLITVYTLPFSQNCAPHRSGRRKKALRPLGGTRGFQAGSIIPKEREFGYLFFAVFGDL